RCRFQNNSTGNGGAISIQGGMAAIQDSTFSGNSALGAGAIEVYSNSTFKVAVSIDRCTFSGNTASNAGGAIAVQLLNPGRAVQIANNTSTGNSVGAGGKGAAIYISAAPVIITNCTTAGNTALGSGGAVHFGGSPASMSNSIIASNGGGNCSFAGGITFIGAHNLQFGDSTCSGVPLAHPPLSPLADNGGPTQTMALAAGSPGIDAADSELAPPTDQ